MQNEKPAVRDRENKFTRNKSKRELNIYASTTDLLYKKIAARFGVSKANVKRAIGNQLKSIEHQVKRTPKRKQPVVSNVTLDFSPYGKGLKRFSTTCMVYKTKDYIRKDKDNKKINLANSWELKCNPIYSGRLVGSTTGKRR
tara:strand:+ start:505 stop:930 length:426 start_codon:yes stop_codon:yes gene_type:complete